MTRDEPTRKITQRQGGLNVAELNDAISSHKLHPIQIEAITMVLAMTDDQVRETLRLCEESQTVTYQT